MKLIRIALRILPHICIILALCFLIFTVLDRYNPLMGFTTNALSSRLLTVFCVVSILTSVCSLIASGKKQ